ncbi:integration host factor, actinobacterial type [Desertihabitans aurantiacus]|uniref:integration host factor, actinobacterial type n=1 Tax=Desertihabitans aurantiacus TaxID=2282477 RepID=UPI000DF724FC|nr:integration host factor, actinobacterial type [Desertihabitans aurantiacus]
MTVPRLSEEQRARARTAAVAARTRRAEAKERLRRGDWSFATLVEQARGDDVLAHIKVVDALRCLPRFGPKRAAELMARHDIAPTRRLRGLGHLQREGLLEELR